VARALAAITLVLAASAIYGVTTSRAFVLAPDGLAVHGAAIADEAAVRHALGLDGSARPNLFALDSSGMAAALRGLPTIDDTRPDTVSVRVVLPDRLVVELHERVAILSWQVGAHRFLVDVEGVLLADAGSADGAAALPGGLEASALPAVVDARSAAGSLHVGGHLDPIDLAVARRIGAVTPAMIDSASSSLSLEVGEEEGYVLHAQGDAWRAVFGIYTSHLRSPDLVAAQVQCLASLLGAQETEVAVVYLFPEGGRCGTYAPRSAAP
jgi:hypothetical protein